MQLVPTDDIPALISILKDADEDSDPLAEIIADKVHTSYFIMVAEMRLGAIVMQWQFPQSEIVSLAIAEAFRGKGHGKSAIALIQTEAQKRQIQTLLVGTANSSKGSSDGSFCLGREELGSEAVYMLYTRLRPGEAPRKVSPAADAEEIIFVIKGNVRVKCSKMDLLVGPGEAFHSKEPASFHVENIGSDDAIFLSAGGHRGAKAAKSAEKAAETAAIEEKEEEANEKEEEQEFIITREDEP